MTVHVAHLRPDRRSTGVPYDRAGVRAIRAFVPRIGPSRTPETGMPQVRRSMRPRPAYKSR